MASQIVLSVSTPRRCLDVVVASVALVLCLPVLAVVAVAILLVDGRPVLFRQVRIGERRVPFTLLKLRTMGSGSGGPGVTAARRQPDHQDRPLPSAHVARRAPAAVARAARHDDAGGTPAGVRGAGRALPGRVPLRPRRPSRPDRTHPAGVPRALGHAAAGVGRRRVVPRPRSCLDAPRPTSPTYGIRRSGGRCATWC